MIKHDTFRRHMNMRDLGGYPAKDGRRIRKGLFYRSVTPALMNDEELEALGALDLSTVIDLRSDEETQSLPDPDIPGAVYKHYNGMKQLDTDEDVDYSNAGIAKMQEAEREKFLDAVWDVYMDMIRGNRAFQYILDNYDKGGLPVLFHCFTGKDRTGAVSFLIMAALGCDKDTILSDYLYSNKSFREEREKARAEKEEAKGAALDDAEEIAILFRYGVADVLGEGMYDDMMKDGSAEAFMKNEYGLDEDKLKAFRDYCLEEGGQAS